MLAEIPLDIILEVTSFLDLQDSLRFIATCSSFHSLASTKDLWFKTLDRIQNAHMQPLPCQFGTDISSLPIAALRKLAIHAYALKKNWSSDRAIPVSVRTFPLGADYGEIRVIPGTNFVVTNSNERFVCWDTTSGASLGAVEHEDANTGYQLGRSPPFQSLGQCFIGLASKSSTKLTLIVVRIDYRDESAVTVSRIYSKILSTPEFQPTAIPDVALDDEVIGMVFGGLIDQFSLLVYCGFQDHIVHRVPLDIRAGLGSTPSCVLYKGNFYINCQSSDEPCTIIRVRIGTSGPSNAEVEKISLHIPSIPEIQTQYVSFAPALLLPPKYGVFNVTRRTSEVRTAGFPERTQRVYFWPAADPGNDSRLEFGEVCAYEHPTEITGPFCGSSGRVAVLIDRGQRRHFLRPQTGLGVVRYAAHPAPHTTFHRLDTAAVGINFYTAVVALDDTLGVVYVTHLGAGAAASMAVLRYA
ncbi:hypothetical protein DFH07DRAFT_851746 [Mycena maculata]|uniref:F-box domain-containing protein n=1 Tax=Mycena maculata TaxID=230809 RepID=A0AAD7MQ01_9AGAR|nr:hypothetical protein DFH07DRAFT_851746 [Mycena maculata]